ncbi:MAG TPA: hypothetical protein VF306_16415 [Pirellulales bacterium]
MHEFTLVLAQEPDEDQADTLYATFQDGTIATVSGTPRIHFHREATTLIEAIRSAIRDVRSAGFETIRVEMQPETVLSSASS